MPGEEPKVLLRNESRSAGAGPFTGAKGPPMTRHRPANRLRSSTRVAALRRRRDDLGMATAEYAIALLAACGFAALLLTLMTSNEVKNLLLGIVKRALSVG